MTAYEWTESEHFFIARVRPKELFDLSTLDQLPNWDAWLCDEGDGSDKGTLEARSLVTGELGAFAYFIDKRKGRQLAERLINGIHEWFLKTDTIDIRNRYLAPEERAELGIDMGSDLAIHYRLRLEAFAARDHLIYHLGDKDARKACKDRSLDKRDFVELSEEEQRLKIRAGLTASPLDCDWLHWRHLKGEGGLSQEEWDSDPLLPDHDDPPDTYLRKLEALRAKFGGELPSPKEWRRDKS